MTPVEGQISGKLCFPGLNTPEHETKTGLPSIVERVVEEVHVDQEVDSNSLNIDSCNKVIFVLPTS